MGQLKDFLNGIALGAAFATGLGFIQYARGKWPFTEMPDNEFHVTQYFNEAKGPILDGPGTRWFIAPIIKRVKDRNKNIVIIPRREQQRDIKNLEYLAQDGTQGMIDIQYRWLIKNKEDAFKFYWQIEDRANTDNSISGRISQVDETLIGKLVETISGRSGIPESLLGITEQIMEQNYLKKLIGEFNKNENGTIYKTFGVTITDLRVINPRPDQASLEILQAPFRAKQQIEATRFKAQATQISIDTYIQAATRIKGLGSGLDAGDIMMYLMDLDNNQEVGETKGTVIKLSPQIPKAISPSRRRA